MQRVSGAAKEQTGRRKNAAGAAAGVSRARCNTCTIAILAANQIVDNLHQTLVLSDSDDGGP
jgi:hypothetical protein